ncbi:hypothetical protein PE067_17240 [Paracoccus sp. DMF-8]|uniref:hypothetical protein n=1 Tax=Paracoccus sp. DMF-8 TaxID=3019445 RepID=UPI0023E3EEF2|nr:hypothetical protein [Paracoccus sp. DMF-8]MDF3607730.1 hypothetical protein [Paracoccus sp. DMF-8]
MIWPGKQFLFVTALFVGCVMAAAMGNLPWEAAVFAGIVVLMHVLPWVWGALTDPVGDLEQGRIVAVDIHIDRRSWYMGRDEPLDTRAVVRMPSGQEIAVAVWPMRLPKAVRKQVFSPYWAIWASSWSTNLAIRDRDDRKRAIDQARDGGYRFELAKAVAVGLRRSEKGRVILLGT